MNDTAVRADLMGRAPLRPLAAVRRMMGRTARSMLRRAAARIETRVPLPVARALRRVQFEWYLQRTHRRSAKRARTLDAARPLRLNLGSGFHPKPGWINIDLCEDAADLQLDLREPLPFPDASADFVYSEHFVEHLSYPNLADSTAWELESPQARSEALTLLRECHRVLRPGGRLDVVVPDAERILDAYAARRERPFVHEDWWGPQWCDTPMHRVNYLFRQGTEHRYAYDFETLRRVLEAVGFTDVERRSFDPELDHRNATRSLFVRATKGDSRKGGTGAAA